MQSAPGQDRDQQAQLKTLTRHFVMMAVFCAQDRDHRPCTLVVPGRAQPLQGNKGLQRRSTGSRLDAVLDVAEPKPTKGSAGQCHGSAGMEAWAHIKEPAALIIVERATGFPDEGIELKNTHFRIDQLQLDCHILFRINQPFRQN